MAKIVLDVGQCPPDHAAICRMLQRHFDVDIVQAHGWSDTREELLRRPCHLVLVNRKLDRDYSDGLDIVRRIQADDATAGVPIMLVSNYAEHQQTAVDAGAEPGFGKAELNAEETLRRLSRFLS